MKIKGKKTPYTFRVLGTDVAEVTGIRVTNENGEDVEFELVLKDERPEVPLSRCERLRYKLVRIADRWFPRVVDRFEKE